MIALLWIDFCCGESICYVLVSWFNNRIESERLAAIRSMAVVLLLCVLYICSHCSWGLCFVLHLQFLSFLVLQSSCCRKEH